jgi:hypothetical protein
LCGARRQLFGANIAPCISLHMSAFGPKRQILRRANSVAIGAKADVTLTLPN